MKTIRAFIIGALLFTLFLATPQGQDSIIRLTGDGWLVGAGNAVPLLLGSNGKGFLQISEAGVITGINGGAFSGGLFGDGTAPAPSIAFASEVGLGAFRQAAGYIGWTGGGANPVMSFLLTGGTPEIRMGSTMVSCWSSSSPNLAGCETTFSRLAAGSVGLSAAGTATTSTDAITLVNTTAALVGTQVQISRRSRWQGAGWDVDDAVTRAVSFFAEVLPTAGNTVSGTWKLGFIDPVASTITYPLQVSSAGGVDTLSYVATSNTAYLAVGARLKLASSADGLGNITNNAGTGIQINNGTAEPTLTSCGTGAVTTGSRNSAGEGTATGATACTVTFGAPAWTNTPFCTVVNGTGARALYITSASTTAFTVNGLTAADKFTWTCIGRI